MFKTFQEELANGEDVAKCPSCSLLIKVIYDIVSISWFSAMLFSTKKFWDKNKKKSVILKFIPLVMKKKYREKRFIDECM